MTCRLVRSLPPHVVDLPRTPRLQDPPDGAAVVRDIEPIPHVGAIPVDRNPLSPHGLQDRQRNEFFGKLVGTIGIGTLGGEHRQAIGAMPGPHQVVRGRLGGRIG